MKQGDPAADLAYLEHIRDAAETIAQHLQGVEEPAFMQSRLVQDAVIRELQIVGEAAKRLSAQVRQQNPDVPWQDIAGMRDKLVHDYFGVDLAAVWLAATQDVPELLGQVRKILAGA
jgi:uncharacterized protein with HEPN domain